VPTVWLPLLGVLSRALQHLQMSHPWLQVSSQLAISLAFAAVSPSIEGDDDVSAVVNRKGVSRAGVADGSIFTHPDTEVT